jgi:hypothetical protein
MTHEPLNKSTKLFLRKLALCLITGALLCTALHLIVHTLPSDDNNRWLISMFDLDTEKNVPTWYASILWFLIAASAFCCYIVEQRRLLQAKHAQAAKCINLTTGRNKEISPTTEEPKSALNFRNSQRTSHDYKLSLIWLFLAAVFLLASADETATIHEEVGSHLQQWHSQGAFGQMVSVGQHLQSSPNSPWIVFYLPVLALVGLVGMAFLSHRMWRHRMLLIFCFLSADCFAIAIAADHYQGLDWDKRSTMAQAIGLDGVSGTNSSITVEETLENFGAIFLILAFAGYAFNETSKPLSLDGETAVGSADLEAIEPGLK